MFCLSSARYGLIKSKDSVVGGGWINKSASYKRGPKNKSFSLLKFDKTIGHHDPLRKTF